MVFVSSRIKRKQRHVLLESAVGYNTVVKRELLLKVRTFIYTVSDMFQSSHV